MARIVRIQSIQKIRGAGMILVFTRKKTSLWVKPVQEIDEKAVIFLWAQAAPILNRDRRDARRERHVL